MCVVSMVGDHYNGKWLGSDDYLGRTYPTIKPLLGMIQKEIIVDPQIIALVSLQSTQQTELAALRKEVDEMKQLLVRAKAYDDANNEPNCEMEDKVELLKRVAAAVGVDLKDIFG